MKARIATIKEVSATEISLSSEVGLQKEVSEMFRMEYCIIRSGDLNLKKKK